MRTFDHYAAAIFAAIYPTTMGDHPKLTPEERAAGVAVRASRALAEAMCRSYGHDDVFYADPMAIMQGMHVPGHPVPIICNRCGRRHVTEGAPLAVLPPLRGHS